MSWIMVDVETDGPVPGVYSMISLGAVLVESEPDLGSHTFYAQFAPITKDWDKEALSISGHTREECLKFPGPTSGMQRFRAWLDEIGGRPLFISDNNGFDWQFVNYYFHRFVGHNPFGHSSTNLGSLYKGLVRDTTKNFKHLRKTKHTHHPVDDAKGNAEALLEMIKMGLKISI